jgi:hypothetical protein
MCMGGRAPRTGAPTAHALGQGARYHTRSRTTNRRPRARLPSFFMKATDKRSCCLDTPTLTRYLSNLLDCTHGKPATGNTQPLPHQHVIVTPTCHQSILQLPNCPKRSCATGSYSAPRHHRHSAPHRWPSGGRPWPRPAHAPLGCSEAQQQQHDVHGPAGCPAQQRPHQRQVVPRVCMVQDAPAVAVAVVVRSGGGAAAADSPRGGYDCRRVAGRRVRATDAGRLLWQRQQRLLRCHNEDRGHVKGHLRMYWGERREEVG